MSEATPEAPEIDLESTVDSALETTPETPEGTETTDGTPNKELQKLQQRLAAQEKTVDEVKQLRRDQETTLNLLSKLLVQRDSKPADPEIDEIQSEITDIQKLIPSDGEGDGELPLTRAQARALVARQAELVRKVDHKHRVETERITKESEACNKADAFWESYDEKNGLESGQGQALYKKAVAEAKELAKERRADGYEIDVQATADGLFWSKAKAEKAKAAKGPELSKVPDGTTDSAKPAKSRGAESARPSDGIPSDEEMDRWARQYPKG